MGLLREERRNLKTKTVFPVGQTAGVLDISKEDAACYLRRPHLQGPEQGHVHLRFSVQLGRCLGSSAPTRHRPIRVKNRGSVAARLEAPIKRFEL